MVLIWVLYHSVACARLFFPAEAKLAMEIAHADTTSEFTDLPPSRSASNLREVDLNETPVGQNKRLHSRIEALNKTGNFSHDYKCSLLIHT